MTDQHVTAIMQHVISQTPNEACGLLAGVEGWITRIYGVPNVSPTPGLSFLMEPRYQLRAMLEIEAQGLDLAAIYHSHPPDSRSDPSPIDIGEAAYPGVLMLIVVPSHHAQSAFRAFSIEREQAVEVPILVTSAARFEGLSRREFTVE